MKGIDNIDGKFSMFEADDNFVCDLADPLSEWLEGKGLSPLQGLILMNHVSFSILQQTQDIITRRQYSVGSKQPKGVSSSKEETWKE